MSGIAGRAPAPPPVIVFYISGHGFGHAARVIEIINAVAEARPDAAIVVRTAVARWLFDVTVKGAFEYQGVECDTGIVQRDSLHLDIPRTIRVAAEFMSSFDERAEAEAAFLRRRGATLVVGDLPPLAFAAADRAGIPSVATGNFTWDWIYAGYEEAILEAPELVPAIRRAYARASLTLRLPMWGGFENWASPIVDLPFVARHSRREPADVRRRLGVPEGRRMVLASFGGYGIAGLSLDRLARLDGYTVVTTGHALGLDGGVPPEVRLLDDREIYAGGLRYEDLVHAADVVVTKPGYGIISECLANGTAMLYTSRGHFLEYDVLVKAMPGFLRCRFIDHADLYGGGWQPHLDALLAQSAPPDRPQTNGAPVAARHLLGVVLGVGTSGGSPRRRAASLSSTGDGP